MNRKIFPNLIAIVLLLPLIGCPSIPQIPLKPAYECRKLDGVPNDSIPENTAVFANQSDKRLHLYYAFTLEGYVYNCEGFEFLASLFPKENTVRTPLSIPDGKMAIIFVSDRYYPVVTGTQIFCNENSNVLIKMEGIIGAHANVHYRCVWVIQDANSSAE